MPRASRFKPALTGKEIHLQAIVALSLSTQMTILNRMAFMSAFGI